MTERFSKADWNNLPSADTVLGIAVAGQTNDVMITVLALSTALGTAPDACMEHFIPDATLITALRRLALGIEEAQKEKALTSITRSH